MFIHNKVQNFSSIGRYVSNNPDDSFLPKKFDVELYKKKFLSTIEKVKDFFFNPNENNDDSDYHHAFSELMVKNLIEVNNTVNILDK